MNKNEKINRRNKRTAIIVLVSLLIWVFALRERETEEPVKMKKIGADGVEIDSDQHGDGRISVDVDPACWTDNTTVVINSAPERTVEEIPQPQAEEVYEAYEDYITPESAEEETAEVEEPEVVETSDAGNVVVAEETGGYEESNPETDTFVGDGTVIGEVDPAMAE